MDRDEAGTTLADQVSDDAVNGGTSSTGTIVVGTTEKNVEQYEHEHEQLHSKVSGEERVSVVWSEDTFTGGNSCQTKDEPNSRQNMPLSIAEAHQNAKVLIGDDAKDSGSISTEAAQFNTRLCTMEKGTKERLGEELLDDEEEIVWVSASASSACIAEKASDTDIELFVNEDQRQKTLPSLVDGNNNSLNSSSCRLSLDSTKASKKRSKKSLLLRPSPASISTDSTNATSSCESKLFLNPEITAPSQQSTDESDQFAFAWAPTWEEVEHIQQKQLPTFSFNDTTNSNGANDCARGLQLLTQNKEASTTTSNYVTDHDDFEICRIRLDEQYDKALEDREVVFRAQYATVCQSTCLSAFVMLLYLAVGCTFYKSHTQWDTTDSLLFTVYSVTTVGYGNHKIPKTVSFQLFTIAYILVGIALLTIMAAQIYEYFVLQATKLRRVELMSSSTTPRAAAMVDDYGTNASMINTFRARFMAELHSQIIDGRPCVERVLDSLWHATEKAKAFMSETSIGRMLSVFLPFCGLILFGALVVGSIEGWTAVESVYWAVVTLTTVGYGDYYPTKASSTWFCIFYLPSSLFVMSLFLAHVASTYIKFTTRQQMRMENRLRERMRRTREAKETAESSNRDVMVSSSSLTEDSTMSTNSSKTDSKRTKRVMELSSESSGKGGEGGYPSPHLKRFSLRKKTAVAPTPGFETLPSADDDEEEEVRSPGNSHMFASESDFIEHRRGLSHRETVFQNSLYPPNSPSRKRRSIATSKIAQKNMKAIIESVKRSVKQYASLDDFDSTISTPSTNSCGTRGTKPSFAVRMLVQERLAQIIATDIAGYHSSLEVKENTLKLKMDSFRRIIQKWLIPRVAQKAFRTVAFNCLIFVGEHGLIVKGADALLELGPLEFNELFSPLLAAMGNRESMVKWLASTNVLADVELKRLTEADDSTLFNIT